MSTQEAEDVSVNGELVMAEPMPVEQAVHWKPLRDAHYILASLQPADGGRRHIVVRQHVLAGVQRRMRGAHGRQVGILLGRFYQCPTTSRNYEVIESFLECSGEGVDDLFSAIATGLEAAKQERGAHVLGWYCSAPTLGPRLGGSLAAIHRAYFQNPWQTTLVVTGGASAPDGVFFLHDDAAARSFYAPFYELPEHGTELRGAKATCIAWSQYLTVEPVILVPVDELLATSSDPHASPATPPGERSVVSTAAPDDRTPEPHATEPPPPVHPLETGISGLLTQLDAVSNDAPRLTSDIREETVRAPAPDRPAELPVERNADTIGGTPVEKTPMPEKRRQWLTALRRAVRRPKSTEGSARDNEAGRFIAEARSAGFVVAATFASVARARRAETFWVLADPDAGIVLTVATTETQVLDATFHYNLHTDEPGLRRTPFPEHRDFDSRTIYVRETCLDSFSARCRRLRETPALEREWRVSPVIYLLTPGEWQFLTVTSVDPEQEVNRIHELNQERIRALPEPMRQQFGLTDGPDASA